MFATYLTVCDRGRMSDILVIRGKLVAAFTFTCQFTKDVTAQGPQQYLPLMEPRFPIPGLPVRATLLRLLSILN